MIALMAIFESQSVTERAVVMKVVIRCRDLPPIKALAL
jgi:hypothetical protein